MRERSAKRNPKHSAVVVVHRIGRWGFTRHTRDGTLVATMLTRPVIDAGRLVGIAHIRDLVANGVSQRTIASRVRNGVWWRPLPRVVALTASRSLTIEQRRVAALLWLPDCAVLSHGDAADLWGVRRPAGDGRVHATVDRGHTPREQRGYAVHRVESLGEPDRAQRSGLPVTSLDRTVVDLHDVLPARADRQALVAHVFQTRRTTAARLLGVVSRVPKLHRRDELLESIDLAAGGAHSVGEAEAVEWLVAAGFPAPERQFPTLVAGRLRYLDAADPVLRIAYEIDGLHHGELAQRDADNERDLQLAAEFWETVRLTTFRIRRDPESLRRDIARLREQRQVLAAAGVLLPARRADVA